MKIFLKQTSLATALICGLLTGSSAPVLAQFGAEAAATERQISQQEAIAIANREAPGKVLSAQRLQVRGQPIFRIKIVSGDGRVRSVDVNARTGRIEP